MGREISQGSSIFSHKDNVSKENSLPAVSVPARLFFDSFKNYLDSKINEYVVILRLNCEGVEDDVICCS